eukprot:1157601-Pelagomonas_calceolata.AAC.6
MALPCTTKTTQELLTLGDAGGGRHTRRAKKRTTHGHLKDGITLPAQQRSALVTLETSLMATPCTTMMATMRPTFTHAVFKRVRLMQSDEQGLAMMRSALMHGFREQGSKD